MNAILYVIVMWVLLQLLCVWFCVRLVEVREHDGQDYLELQEYIARLGLNVDVPDTPPAPTSLGQTYLPPAGVARA
jgi:hypothetical protein